MVHGFSIIIPGRVDLFEKSRPRKCAINPRSEEKWIIRQLRLGVNPLFARNSLSRFYGPPYIETTFVIYLTFRLSPCSHNK